MMKNILILFIATSIIASCGNSDSDTNIVDQKNDPQKNIFVSECVASANNVNPRGGDIYYKQCTCTWNKTLESMNTTEVAAMRREWSKPSDFQYYSTFLSEVMNNSAQCLDDLF
jgi:hypothetical protein